ncbi:GLPGLI family protein [Marinirhabdus gelatinilytica]|uniref:GLPGLI family protein n=1 Tax=Marinirhabdus gelatinilytica TaxID=1703343 RepID=A0A370Q635_9FLAO|nr:GLPGLI family protein [Marinirhabdus gelatinilytica]RDK83821.1 GLPGLI family protein [Marinirhabdus gelatinilytica]
MKLYTLVLVVLFSTFSFAQNISGKAYYESKTTVDMDNFGGREMSEQMKKMIAERMKSMLEKTYILTFNKNESIYKEEEKLESGPGGGFGMMMNSFSAGAQYKNLEKNQILEEREFFGKQFLINDTISNLEWQVTDEKKMIGNYLAVKATAIKKIDSADMAFARPRRGREDRKKDDAEKAKEEKIEVGDEGGGNTNETANGEEKKEEDPMNNFEIPEEIEVTAWFTPQIPVSNGPGEYAGLPGLILEMNMYRTTILCSKIVLSTKAGEKIEAPDKGDEVTREEYNKIVKEKMEEMRENFRGRGRGGRRGF